MNFTVIDVEASGLDTIYDTVHQFAYAVINEHGKVFRAEKLYYYYDGAPYHEEAYAIHGITRETLRKHESELQVNLTKMYCALNKANIVGYNSGWITAKGNEAGFDLSICRNFLIGQGLPHIAGSTLYDVMLLYWKHTGKRWKLTELCKEMNVTPELINMFNKQCFGEESAAHDAGYDVAATMLLFLQAYRLGWVDTSGFGVREDVGEDYIDTTEGALYLTLSNAGVMEVYNPRTKAMMSVQNVNESQPGLFKIWSADFNTHLYKQGSDGIYKNGNQNILSM